MSQFVYDIFLETDATIHGCLNDLRIFRATPFGFFQFEPVSPATRQLIHHQNVMGQRVGGTKDNVASTYVLEQATSEPFFMQFVFEVDEIGGDCRNLKVA